MEIELLSKEINKIVRELGDKLAGKNSALDERIAIHVARTDNPHRVTKKQVGLGKLPNGTSIDREDNSSERVLLAKGMYDHTNNSTDHDERYYTHQQIDTKDANVLQSAKEHTNLNVNNTNLALDAHKSSTDHDDQYYTHQQVDDKDASVLTQAKQHTDNIDQQADSRTNNKFIAHNESGDHDGRYYTQSQVSDLFNTLVEDINAEFANTVGLLETHKDSNDHDERYYTQTQLNSKLALKVDISSIVDNLTSTIGDVPLSANQGRVLKGLIDQINTTILSDDATLDELQEIVDFIKLNRNELDALSITGVAGLTDALDSKVDKVVGKELSKNDFTDSLLSKLQGIEATAEVNRPITNSRKTNSGTTVLSAKGMNDHCQSGDHDGRYYTKNQLDTKLSKAESNAVNASNTALNNHKSSGDHDDRYYTHQQVDDKFSNLNQSITDGVVSDLTTHKSSNDHDGRYYTKNQVSDRISSAESRANALTDGRYEQLQKEFVRTDIKVAAGGDDVESMKGTEQSFQEIFNNWMRFSRDSSSLGNNAKASELTEWNYNSTNDTIECAINSTTYIGFISPDKFDEYVFEVKMSSTSNDDDWITVVAAYAEDGNGNGHTLDVVRALNGAGPLQVYYNFNTSSQILLETINDPLNWGDGSVASGSIGGNSKPGWGNGSPNGVRVKITRTGDNLKVETTQTDDGSDNYLTGATVTIDLNSRPELSLFKGPKQYGIGARSQAESTWEFLQKPSSLEDIIDIVGGVVWEYNSQNGWTSKPLTDPSQYITPNRVYRNGGRVFISDDDGNILEVAMRDPQTGNLHVGQTVTIGGPNASGARYSVSYDSDTDSLDVTHLG